LSTKLRIAIIGSRGYPYVYSGYETLVKELAERLVKSGNEVTVYCHRKLFNEKPKKVNGVHLVYTPSVRSKVFSQLYNSFFSFVHVCFSKSDVVLVVNTANGPFGILTKIFRKKTCINVDGLEWLRPKWKGFGSLYFRVASKLATLFFDEIITDSIEMNKVYQDKFGKNSKVIAYGSTMKSNKKSKILEKLSLKKKDYYLIVGRLIPDNNSKLIIEGFLNSNSKKSIVIVGDVPYNDDYANNIKSLSSEKVIFTGYVNNQIDLTVLYDNCYGYIHGHEFGGTNPTMINALDLNCQILALDTIFNREMLYNKKSILFNKNENSISNKINEFEARFDELVQQNNNYKIPKKYDWDFISNQYLEVFQNLTNYQNK
jgi:glycosyltransferase involved in cell wall biosynthesis